MRESNIVVPIYFKTSRSNVSSVDEITIEVCYVTSYIDDVLVHGKTELKAQEYTQEVISIIENTGFKANHDKTHLAQPEMKYSEIVLGQEVTVMLRSPKGRNDYESSCLRSSNCITFLELLTFL